MNSPTITASAEELDWLTTTLTGQIPLGAAMGLSIQSLDHAGIVLAAPLGPNINDKGTAFGGALVSLMILAGWSLARLSLRRAGVEADLVIGRCETRFLRPVDEAFRARCAWPQPAAIDTFFRVSKARGKARIDLAPEIESGGVVAASLQARYAALAST